MLRSVSPCEADSEVRLQLRKLKAAQMIKEAAK